jgi:hypothetical protein
MVAATGISRVVAAWLGSLDAAQRARATFPFDTEERFVWAYTPVSHEGLALADMTAAQRDGAMSMLTASLSARGAAETRAIIDLETVLGELERTAGRAGSERRDPLRYWFGVFGDPADTASPWAWRLGGHHVCVHVTVASGVIVSATPSFLGANPAVVPSGPTAGSMALTGEETLARRLLSSLRPDQRAIAVVDPVAPPDIRSGTGRRAATGRIPTGVARGALDVEQQGHFDLIVRHYLGRAREDVAADAWERLAREGLDESTFAWAGQAEPGHGHYYAVRGGSLLIEYDNTQNGANHIHAVWRDLANDWGDDVLAAHYRRSHA